MSITSPPAAPPKVGGRPLLWLGLLAAVAGVPLYMLQLRAANLMTPWYAPALASLGAALVLLSLRRRPTVWRCAALLLAGLIAGGEWWFLASYVRLPAATGRVAAGRQLPEFAARRADGTPFTPDDLKGDKETVLVFFRGRW
ncbi:MAG TPA: hypothetical protein VFW33_20025 [Gemmataceae bacterium]|nr:hypothetical protein [Gemmataceae bacterium]